MEADRIMGVVPDCFEIQVRQGANAQPPSLPSLANDASLLSFCINRAAYVQPWQLHCTAWQLCPLVG